MTDITTAQASALIGEVWGESPEAVTRMAFGHNSVTFEVKLRSRSLMLRTNTDAKVFKKTAHNLRVLRQLGLPVPTLLMSDLSLARYPVAYMLLEKIPGRDLRFELAGMTPTQQTRLAEQIVGFQRAVATLPEGRGFGYAPLGEAAPLPSWLELVVSEIEKSLPADPSAELLHWRERAFGTLEGFTPYLERIRPVCFLDDVTTKNVITQQGELRGLIDFDVVCYGDPLWALGLTGCAIVADIGPAQLSYVTALSHAYGLDDVRRRVVRLYAALFALTFWERADDAVKDRLRHFLNTTGFY